MLPTLRSARAEFGSAADALALVSNRAIQRFIVPLRDLTLDSDGRLFHVGIGRIGVLQRVPLTDDALEQLHRLLGVPAAYAARIDPALHETTLRELLGRHLGVGTVVVEHERDDPDARLVVAVSLGARPSVPNDVVLARLVSLGVDAVVRIRGGVLDARFGSGDAVDWLPGDAVRVRGALVNDAFGERPSRSSLEVSMFLLRLVCENGLFAQREVATRRAHSWSSSRELASFVDRQIDRVITFPHDALKRAAARMAEEVCSEGDRAAARRLVERHVSDEAATAVVRSTSMFDLMNALTGAAHNARSEAGALRLQVAGGALLDRYVEVSR